MAGGEVNRTVMESYYQNAGDVYSDLETEGVFNVLANQIDMNWRDYNTFKSDIGIGRLVDGGYFVDVPSNTIDGGSFT